MALKIHIVDTGDYITSFFFSAASMQIPRLNDSETSFCSLLTSLLCDVRVWQRARSLNVDNRLSATLTCIIVNFAISVSIAFPTH